MRVEQKRPTYSDVIYERIGIYPMIGLLVGSTGIVYSKSILRIKKQYVE